MELCLYQLSFATFQTIKYLGTLLTGLQSIETRQATWDIDAANWFTKKTLKQGACTHMDAIVEAV